MRKSCVQVVYSPWDACAEQTILTHSRIVQLRQLWKSAGLIPTIHGFITGSCAQYFLAYNGVWSIVFPTVHTTNNKSSK